MGKSHNLGCAQCAGPGQCSFIMEPKGINLFLLLQKFMSVNMMQNQNQASPG